MNWSKGLPYLRKTDQALEAGRQNMLGYFKNNNNKKKMFYRVDIGFHV